MSGGEPSSIKRDYMCREGAGSERMLAESVSWCVFVLLPAPSPASNGVRPRPLYLHGASPAPNPGVLFPRRNSTQKCASLRLERLQCCFIDATAGLCDGYRRCTPVATAVMVRLPERLALSSYPSFGLEACCLIHMKYGCETHLALLWIPRFVSNQTAASNKPKGRQPKPV